MGVTLKDRFMKIVCTLMLIVYSAVIHSIVAIDGKTSTRNLGSDMVQKDSMDVVDIENDVFVILTSDSVFVVDSTTKIPQKGIFRIELVNPIPSIKRGISYVLIHKSKKINIDFDYNDYNVDSLYRNNRLPMRQLIYPKSFLSRITPIDMDKEFPRMKNQKESHEFIDKYYLKRFWIIDRRYMTDSTIVLLEADILPVPRPPIP